MKKALYCLLIAGFILTVSNANAQFRSIPGIVTDSFKLKYPDAKTVTWRDQISYFQAKFSIGNDKYTAKYSSKGEWISAQKEIIEAALPPAVKDGFSKSKYAGEWTIFTVVVIYLPNNITQYGLRIGKGEISRKNLLFSSEGQLLKDGTTL